ncbi:MAG: ATP-grasp domain-containing protein [Desulfovibrionaceae bacterium]|nr:ATP-grasp domain-containing protein [Desulfovibrionaceae bacterium]
MPAIAVAAISARAMAEAAACDGFEVVALDLFGDADTLQAASRWLAIGEPGGLRIDAGRLLAALRQLAHPSAGSEPLAGWVAGSGFDGRPELLEQGVAMLPLIGVQAGAVRRLRDPSTFFGFLAAQGVAHPRVRRQPPEEPSGWLLKDAHGCGGWHIRRASRAVDAPLPRHCYFQREAPGQPMSATFLANGSDVHVLGFNELNVRRCGSRPFVFHGAIGPVPVSAEVARRMTAAARLLTREFALRGLCSLDVLRDAENVQVLEVNPRPPASMSLYGEPGLMQAHVRACVHGQLPTRPASEPRASAVRGTEIVFARRAFTLDAAAAHDLAAQADVHDLPAAGQRFRAHDPVCTVSASGISAAQVRQRLNQGRERLLRFMETLQ